MEFVGIIGRVRFEVRGGAAAAAVGCVGDGCVGDGIGVGTGLVVLGCVVGAVWSLVRQGCFDVFWCIYVY